VLRDIEGLSTDQTAAVLELSFAAVKARLWRARLQLRELLSEHFTKHKEPDRVQVRSEIAPPCKVSFLGKTSFSFVDAVGS